MSEQSSVISQLKYISIFLGMFLFSSLAFASGGHGSGEGMLRLNITDGYYDLSGVWDNQTTIFDGKDFQLNITNRGSKTSKNTTVIVSLHPDDSGSISSVSVNGHAIPQSEFGFGTPGWIDCSSKHYQSFSPHGIFPANYSTYDVGNIPAGKSILVTINISSSLEFPRTHYDAVGFSLKEIDDEDVLCQDFKNPNSDDAGTDGHDNNVPFFPTYLAAIAAILAAPVAAYRLTR